MQDKRPDPDRILHQIQQQEADAAHVRGRLKIFFGYAAGVGKTYAMLEAAHAALAAGTDVVAGYIEPHTRPDTLALLEGLEQLPPLCVEYKNVTLREFDLDAAIARRPALLLVDELAHTNAEGCRHRKRCQDIEELLALGIDVYTTVNVQHLESLNDIVAAVTGITVRERVPDSVFDNAIRWSWWTSNPMTFWPGWTGEKFTVRFRPAAPWTIFSPERTLWRCGKLRCAARPTV